MNRRTAVLTAGLLTAVQHTAVHAQEASVPVSVSDVLSKRAEADLSVPPSPAFALLGLTPTSIQRPGTVRELLASATKGFDRNGKVKNGLAIDVAPYPLLAPQRVVGGQRYIDDTLTQVLARTTVSLATAESAGVSQLAWGLRVGLLDRGDPGLFANELATCVRQAKPFGDQMPGGANVDPLPDDQEAKIASAIAKCAPNEQFPLWAKPALYVGLGQSWYSGSGSVRDNTPAMKAFWATYSVGQPMGSYRGLLQLHAERKIDDRVADKNDASKLLRQDNTSLVARLKLGAEKWHAYADVGHNRVDLDGSAKTTSRYRGLGLELRLRDDLWLQVGRASESGLPDGSTQNRVLTGLRWGSKPVLSTAGGQ